MITNNEPLVSVVVNCHNGDQYLREAIDSVYAQTYSNWEIIFWDNASTDNSKAIAQSYDNRVCYYCSNELVVLGEARNRAMKEVKGKYIAFLDCDDTFFPEKIAKQVALMESTQAALSYSGVLIIDEKGNKIKLIKPNHTAEHNFVKQLERYEIMMPSVMLSSAVIKDEKLSFEISLKFCPDYCLFMQILIKHPVAIISKPLVSYRRHSNSLSLKVLNIMEAEMRYVLDLLKTQRPDIYLANRKHYDLAYLKLCIPRARSLIARGEIKKARLSLEKVWWVDMHCCFLYWLLFLPKNQLIGLVKILKLNLVVLSDAN